MISLKCFQQLMTGLDDEQSGMNRIQRTIKELQARVEELEEELEAERQGRTKAERFVRIVHCFNFEVLVLLQQQAPLNGIAFPDSKNLLPFPLNEASFRKWSLLI
jgi:hypothetical protein